jgi:hypothetical protein
MLYQLSNGKVIYLSIEEYLSLSDQDLHELANSGYGDEPCHSFFYGKQKRDKQKPKEIPLDIPKEDEDIDPNNINFDDLD